MSGGGGDNVLGVCVLGVQAFGGGGGRRRAAGVSPIEPFPHKHGITELGWIIELHFFVLINRKHTISCSKGIIL